MLLGIDKTCCRVDDILITGQDDKEHMSNVKQVVDRLEQAGFRCRLDKSKFMEPKVIYLGHEVSAQGIKPVTSKVETLNKAGYPESRDQMIAFLGAVQYYARYLPNLSTVIEPLNKLRSTQVKWNFGKAERLAFDELKKMLTSEKVLAFYDPKVPLKIDCDASSVGLGGVISHKYPNGEERPIEFVSRTLSDAERRYSQLDREALAIVWCLKKFHKYVYAVPFELVTDNKPLQYILHQSKGIPEMVVSRVQRWALILANYNYTISYRPTGKHANADLCSRFPLPNRESAVTHPDSVVCGSVNECSVCVNSVYDVFVGEDKPLLNSVLISKLSRTDPVIAKVLLYTLEGWPERPIFAQKTAKSGESASGEQRERPKSAKNRAISGESASSEQRERPKSAKNRAISGESASGEQRERPVNVQNMTSLGEASNLRPYYEKRGELSVDSGCLMWGGRVVVPVKMRADVLDLLHNTHMGSSAMKNMARRYVWWPGMDHDIEMVSKTCKSCQLNQPLPTKTLPHPWDVPEHPWHRIHIDFAGPFGGVMWLVVVCSYSKWLEVVNMKSNTTAANLIVKLREIFSCFGLPRILVSDNGVQLSRSSEFTSFLQKNGVRFVPIPTYHPSSNGQAESMVGKFKQAMRKMAAEPGDINSKLSNWLFQYRNTPHSATGQEPAVLMFGRRPRTALSLINPCTNNETKHEKKVAKQREEVMMGKSRSFGVGDEVYYRDVNHKQWIEGVVQSLEGSKIVLIAAGGSLVRKHIDHVVGRSSRESSQLTQPAQPNVVDYDQNSKLKVEQPLIASEPEHSPSLSDSSLGQTSNTKAEIEHLNPPGTVARPKRSLIAPDRLNYDKLGG